jgi:hypothetical protein
MRRFLAILIMSLFIAGICVEAHGASATITYTNSGLQTSPGVGLIEGAGQPLGTPVRKFRAVRFFYHGTTGDTGTGANENINVSPDSVVMWDSSATGDDGVTVTTAISTSDSRVAGVLITGVSWVSDDDCTTYATDDARNGKTRNWTWMQTSGHAYVLILKNVVSGDMLTVGGALPQYRAMAYGTGTQITMTDASAKGVHAPYFASGDAQYRGTIGVALDSGTATAAGARVRVLLKGLE